MENTIRIKDAISILKMMLAGRNSAERRVEIEAALHDLQLAASDSEARQALHYPPGHESRRA